MILLTTEEMVFAVDSVYGKQWREGWDLEDVIEDGDRAIAKAQLKKVVGWLSLGIVPSPHPKYTEKAVFFMRSRKDWNSLLKEIDEETNGV